MAGQTYRYPLGNTQAEHERLARQAKVFDPLTERLFREAGIGAGMRVLDLGSGAGDVSMLLSRIVGPSGQVVGVERSADSIAHAQQRVSAARADNVRFVQADVAAITAEAPFDAAVGRWILMFVPDPVAVLKATIRLVKPGGSVAFQEVWWDPVLMAGSDRPLASTALSLLHAMLGRSNADAAMGMALRRVYLEAGLPSPAMRLEMPLHDERAWSHWLVDTIRSMRLPNDTDARFADLGDLDALPGRIEAETAAARAPAPWLAMVGAWTTTEG